MDHPTKHGQIRNFAQRRNLCRYSKPTIRGFKGIQLLRREVIGEVEFITIMTFESLDAVREFAGDDDERAVVPEKARNLLSRFDERSQHYEIVIE